MVFGYIYERLTYTFDLPQGMLRINSFSGPHLDLDSSYVTMIGAGNVLGALQFAEARRGREGGGEEQEQEQEASRSLGLCHAKTLCVAARTEEALRPRRPSSSSLVPTKLGGLTSEVCRPLMHQAFVPPEPEQCLAATR